MSRVFFLLGSLLILATYVVWSPSPAEATLYLGQSCSVINSTMCNNQNDLCTCLNTAVGKRWICDTAADCTTSITPTLTPTLTPTPTTAATPTIPPPAATATPVPPTPTSAPVITAPPNCSLKGLGDATCDSIINDLDYTIWACQAAGNSSCGAPDRAADFDLKNGVNINDFEIWRRNNININPPPPTPTPSGPAMYDYMDEDATNVIGQTVQDICRSKGSQWNCTPSCIIYNDPTFPNNAFLRMTQGVGANTMSGDDCYYVVPDNISYISVCCDDNDAIPPTLTPTPSIEPAPTDTPQCKKCDPACTCVFADQQCPTEPVNCLDVPWACSYSPTTDQCVMVSEQNELQ
ncbi:hypothetical protein A2403_02140 [Candidatus Roizmanbacteria bacterium RIFOXYC1_FULL_41_16]|nr:MAG: hypothetical protein A2377_02565 [Candidatus Roizmanbacteria bacterium RIFOXYB1_FULL_41_27]OGK70860.1 MAG: hypothetical protein A2403_02140 [Candidatus Roizmanbacteria bacterium RIFOXYC1_FULL_41_16]